jgi:hypothetical protein
MPAAKAAIEGATPNEIWCSVLAGCSSHNSEGVPPVFTHKIRQRVELCAHQAALSPPPRDHAVEEVEQKAERHQSQGCPQVAGLVRRAEAVAQGELDRHDTAEAVHEGDEVGEVVSADQAEVAWVLGLEEVGLLVLGWVLLVLCKCIHSRCILTRLLYGFFGSFLDAIGDAGSLGHVGGIWR